MAASGTPITIATTGLHSVNFIDGPTIVTSPAAVIKNTRNDWYLVPSSRPVIAQPPYVEKFVDIPGRDGSLDLTNFLMGHPVYQDRTGSLEFIVINDNINGIKITNRPSWEIIRYNMTSFLHGKSIKMVLEDDPLYYFVGRFKVSEWKSEADYSKVNIEYRLQPYKVKLNDSGDIRL